LLFLLHYFCNDFFIYYKDSKTPKITQFGALAGQIQHTPSQKVGFTPRLLRQMALICTFQAQLHRNQLHSRAKLETCKLGHLPQEHAKTVPFLASDNPLWDIW
jgi:hypothetical protein